MFRRVSAVALGLAVGLGAGCGGAWSPPPAEAPRQWAAAAGGAHDDRAPEAEAVTEATVRMIVRTTVAGPRVRVRLDNRMSDVPVTIGGVSMGTRAAGAAVVPGSLRRVTFGDAFEVTLPAGGGVTSDPVDLPVAAGAEVAVSLYVPGTAVRPSRHRDALVTSYRTADRAGNAVGEESGEPFRATTTRLLFVTGLDVLTQAPGAIVAFGSSSTDGTGATLDAYDRWTDRLAERLAERPPARRPAVVNSGIGGNTLLDWPSVPGDGPHGLARLDADALDLAGVTHLIVFHGSNDISRGASASQLIAGLESVSGRAAERGVVVIGATIGPRIFRSPTSMNAVRQAVNDWIRHAPGYHGVIDFDAALRDPADPNRLRPEYDSGDGTHPNPAGYAAMAEAVDLGLFAPAPTPAP